MACWEAGPGGVDGDSIWKLARRFLQLHWVGDGVEAEALTGAEVVAFLLRESQRASVGSAKGRVAELRSLLKFLFVAG